MYGLPVKGLRSLAVGVGVAPLFLEPPIATLTLRIKAFH